MKSYDLCPPEVRERVQALLETYYSELREAEVTFDLIFASSDNEKPAICHRGMKVGACIRPTTLTERVAGRKDVEILINREYYNSLTDPEKDALIDHELYHLVVMREKDTSVAVDDHYRPKLRMRIHDYEFGWFDEVARRHGGASGEVRQAKKLVIAARQTIFPFLEEMLREEQIVL